MCGIAGIHGLDAFPGKDEALGALRDMVAAMGHRGPDAEGVWCQDDVVALGHRRLSILDPTSGSNQPFALGRDVLVFNGEVYNYVELRRDLEASGAHRFQTDSDTEVVLAALRHWGLEQALGRMNGMFAFAWWNPDTERLVVARDRLGIKPLYWHQTPHGTVLFASEIRALLASGVLPRKLNQAHVTEQWMYGTVHAPATIVQGVHMLEPGSLLVLEDDQVRTATWWDPADAALGEPDASPAERKDRLRALLSDAVGIRMRSDVDYGAFLSGGIDSSAVVGLMAEQSNQPIKTFSITFKDQALDEGPWSRMVAQRFRTDHHQIGLEVDDFLAQIPAGLEAMDHPSADGLNTFVVSGETRRAGVKVALSGLGGDELFAGYPVFERSAQLAKLAWLASWPRGWRKAGGWLMTRGRQDMPSRKKAEVLAGNHFDLAHTYPVSRQLFLRKDLEAMLRGVDAGKNPMFQWLVKALAPGQKAFGLPFLSQVSLAEMRTYMGHTLLRDADQFSMAHALEVRVPLLDHRIVAAALATPDSEKRGSTPKPLLVQSVEDLLPTELVNRPKMGFVLPWESWMRGPLKGVCSQGLQSLCDQPWVNADAIRAMESSFLQGSDAWTWGRVWSLAVLGHYLERHGLR